MVLEIDQEDELQEEEIENNRVELSRRCSAAEITCDVQEVLGERLTRVHLRAGRQTRAIALFSDARIKEFLSIPFEKYVFLQDYDAICCYEEGFIESALTAFGPISRRALARLLGQEDDLEQNDKTDLKVELYQSPEHGKAKIVLGPPSAELQVLVRTRFRNLPSLRIENLEISQHDRAVEILEKISNSLFFQIDLSREMYLGLSTHRQVRRPFRRGITQTPAELEFPLTEYNPEPIALYSYARNAIGMPLLQFLAYYQTIEFYFPIYSLAEARRRIKNILKNPAFRYDRDTDVAKIVSAIKGVGPGYGDERAQLRATLNECLDSDSIRSFITEYPERANILSAKVKGLTDHKITISNPASDLRNDVADRIYDIRCKIVHTKSGSYDAEVKLLLPFSQEAESLFHDIELIQYCAREVLISASAPLRL